MPDPTLNPKLLRLAADFLDMAHLADRLRKEANRAG
jgi:hypothetical protein